jgi:hypothetical protein
VRARATRHRRGNNCDRHQVADDRPAARSVDGMVATAAEPMVDVVVGTPQCSRRFVMGPFRFPTPGVTGRTVASVHIDANGGGDSAGAAQAGRGGPWRTQSRTGPELRVTVRWPSGRRDVGKCDTSAFTEKGQERRLASRRSAPIPVKE